jgi:hypothetical protein
MMVRVLLREFLATDVVRASNDSAVSFGIFEDLSLFEEVFQ